MIIVNYINAPQGELTGWRLHNGIDNIPVNKTGFADLATLLNFHPQPAGTEIIEASWNHLGECKITKSKID